MANKSNKVAVKKNLGAKKNTTSNNNKAMKKNVVLGAKIIVSLIIVFIVSHAFFIDGYSPYYTVREYSYTNDFLPEQMGTVQDSDISQHFIARGNIITDISLYVINAESGSTTITLTDVNGKKVKAVEVTLSGENANSWLKIGFDCHVSRGLEYVLTVNSPTGVGSFVVDSGDKPETYINCSTSQGIIDGSLAVGIHQTYRYMTMASTLELVFSMLMSIFLISMLVYAVFEIDKLVETYRSVEEKRGVLFASYFATTLVLIFNPIDSLRTEVTSFGRVFGQGMNANVDVARRISNFNHWFIYFAVAFGLFFLLTNHMMKKELSENKAKVARFLDQFIIFANVNLVLRIITYFADSEANKTIFYYSSSVTALVVLLCLLYVLLDLDKKVAAEDFLKIETISFAAGFPIAIILQKEWQSGKLLFGVQMLIMLLAALASKYISSDIFNKKRESILTACAFSFSLIPFVTSFYIEFVNVLNQYNVFMTHIRRYYALSVLISVIVITALIYYIVGIKRAHIKNWKTWIYSFLIFGMTCLNVQIPLEKIYNADIFETANSSILISDFLGFGDIPIVQHYGGHMMTGVWEGILYAFVNNDNAGAIFSPYSGYLMTVLALLFFFLVRRLWDEDIALFVTLLFPFYGVWSYYGLGMLVCLAVWGYLKKNTWIRAVLVWAAFVWCALYRLDLGFATGAACILALIVYVLVKKNWTAAKQLGITLISWGMFGGVLWSILCLAKGLNPIKRLFEFLYINLSNQDWAYTGIGNAGNTLFAWCYIIIPFIITGSMLYIIFSKKFREEADERIWIALLLFGFSYYANFSRGLVRHSLAETSTTIVLWDAYLFIAIFVAAQRKNKGLFLPLFALLMMCNTFFTTTANYNASPIGNGMASHIGDFTSQWTLDEFAYEDLPAGSEPPLTYWQNIAYEGEKVERTEWDPALKQVIKPYQVMIDGLLDANETFVDFINKTFVYSAIGRRNPVYVSQSPLQLSGQYTQERFVEEIKDVPLVLMPLNNERAASYLDGVANAYRYYKVAEYIYQNYVPLCKYGSTFAVWCLPERYDEFTQKLDALSAEEEYVDAFSTSDQLSFSNCERRNENASEGVVIAYTGTDPIVGELQNIIDISKFIDGTMRISVEYETDTDGQMQVFYTFDEGESYTGEKVSTVNIAGSGLAVFDIPVSDFTRIRLDTPEGSTVVIKSLKVSFPVEGIDYGYDGPEVSGDGTTYSYDNGFHTYSIGYLPSIWADYDDALQNEIIAECHFADGVYSFDRAGVSEEGNYLLIQASYDGNDNGEAYEEDDEAINAVAKLGVYENDTFVEKYQFGFTMEEGTHNYLLRVSCDYNWYSDGVNVVKIQSDNTIYNVSVNVLKGD